MRIISGTYRRRILKEVMSDATRSTKDRVKESLFNSLTPLSQYKRVLDAFAGSGALGLEALSRGSEHVTFIEKDKEAFHVVKDNVHTLEVTSQVTLHYDDTMRVLKSMDEPFDLILLDPPYNKGHVSAALKWISELDLLTKEGKIVVLTSHTEEIESIGTLKVSKQKKYGLTKVTLITRSD